MMFCPRDLRLILPESLGLCNAETSKKYPKVNNHSGSPEPAYINNIEVLVPYFSMWIYKTKEIKIYNYNFLWYRKSTEVWCYYQTPH